MLNGTTRATAHDRGALRPASVFALDQIRDAHRGAERRESFGTITVAI